MVLPRIIKHSCWGGLRELSVTPSSPSLCFNEFSSLLFVGLFSLSWLQHLSSIFKLWVKSNSLTFSWGGIMFIYLWVWSPWSAYCGIYIYGNKVEFLKYLLLNTRHEVKLSYASCLIVPARLLSRYYNLSFINDNKAVYERMVTCPMV